MKELMKRVFAFITFEQLVSKNQIELKYQHFCNPNQQQLNAIGLITARHTLICEYWYNHVIKHFGFMLFVATIITHLSISKINLSAVVIAGTLSIQLCTSLLQVYFQLYSTSQC